MCKHVRLLPCTYQLLNAGRLQSLVGKHGVGRSLELDSLGMEVAVSYGEGVGVTAQAGSLAVVEAGAGLVGRGRWVALW